MIDAAIDLDYSNGKREVWMGDHKLIKEDQQNNE